MLSIKIVNKGFNYSQDGPGNRLVYHLFGCNMRCPWCANPEALFDGGESFELSSGEVLRQALSAQKIMIDGGGVTFTGGEPTLQGKALIEALSLLREHDFHTAMETNGTSDIFADFLPLLSLLIIDFKHYDDARHRAATGFSNAVIIKNIRAACVYGLPVWIRTPLIGGFNASEDDICGFLDVYSTLDTGNVSFELLPYHEYGRDKWEKLGYRYAVADGAVGEASLGAFEDAYRRAGLRVIRT